MTDRHHISCTIENFDVEGAGETLGAALEDCANAADRSARELEGTVRRLDRFAARMRELAGPGNDADGPVNDADGAIPPVPPKDTPDPLLTADAVQWAEAFMQMRRKHGWGVDAETMVSWFAAALMRGHDEHAQKWQGVEQFITDPANWYAPRLGSRDMESLQLRTDKLRQLSLIARHHLDAHAWEQHTMSILSEPTEKPYQGKDWEAAKNTFMQSRQGGVPSAQDYAHAMGLKPCEKP